MLVALFHQTITKENAMDRVARQIDPLARQNLAQLARSPIRVALPRLDHALLQVRRGAMRADQRPAAALGDPGHTTLLVTAQPQITSGTRNPKLLTQRAKRPRPALGGGHELHALLLHIHSPP